MVPINIRTRIKIESDPGLRRAGIGPLMAGIVTGWVFSVLWLVVAAATFPFNIYWSLVIGGAAVTFGCLLGLMSYGLLRDAKRRYVLELNDSEAVLVIVDNLRHRKAVQMVLLDDIIYAEYYPYSDSSSIILHTPYTKMEVPLWPMGRRAQDVLDFLDGHGVRIVNVQSDDPIPEPGPGVADRE